jgi:general secretion pathway protein L
MTAIKPGRPMGHALNNLQQYARNAAHRAGLPRFWRWWSAELAPLIPAASRGAMRRRLTRPVVEFGDGEAVFWRPLVVESELRLIEVARVALSGDAGELAAAGRAAMNALVNETATEAAGESTATPKVVIALPAKQIMRKTLVLPSAVEENLAQTLSYDLDRHTPFRPEQLYFDATVIARTPASKTITVDWVAALRTAVDSARRQVEDWGGVVVAVVPGPVLTRSTRLNLIPHEARPRSALWRRWQLWAPLALLAVGLLAVLAVPLLQKREYAIALNRQTETAREQAEASDALRTQLERQQGDYNYALTKKYAYPGAVQIIDDITRLLPDDTWITQMEVRSTVRGKDNVRELTLRGESANAGALISTLEDSKLVEQAALQSPTTKLQPGPGEVFVLGSRLRAGALPVPVPVALVAATPAAPEPSAAPGALSPEPSTLAAPTPATDAATAAAGAGSAAAAGAGPAPAPAPAAAPPVPAPNVPATAAAPSAAMPQAPVQPGTADVPPPSPQKAFKPRFGPSPGGTGSPSGRSGRS